MILRELSLSQSAQVYQQHLRRDFPESELKPWFVMEQAAAKGQYDFLAAYEGEQMVGYAWQFRPAQGAILIDYLAIVPELRGRGCGTALLDALRRYYAPSGQPLLLESEYPGEAPDEAEAKRRLAFYFRAGLQDSGVQTRLFGVRFCILTFEPLADPRRAIYDIYHTMLDEERFSKFFCIL